MVIVGFFDFIDFVVLFCDKEEVGYEVGWFVYFFGEFLDYLVWVLEMVFGQVVCCVVMMFVDDCDLDVVYLYFWQCVNFVVIEVLIQFVGGVLQVFYNGGFGFMVFCYENVDCVWFGFLEDVVVFVYCFDDYGIGVQFVNIFVVYICIVWLCGGCFGFDWIVGVMVVGEEFGFWLGVLGIYMVLDVLIVIMMFDVDDDFVVILFLVYIVDFDLIIVCVIGLLCYLFFEGDV